MLASMSKSATSAAQQLTVRSALNPVLWLTGIASPLFLTAAYLFRENQALSYTMVAIAALPVIVGAGCFIYLAVTKPEKLQSEDYQLRHESLQIIQQKSGQLVLDPASLTAIANPARLSASPEQEDRA